MVNDEMKLSSNDEKEEEEENEIESILIQKPDDQPSNEIIDDQPSPSHNQDDHVVVELEEMIVNHIYHLHYHVWMKQFII